MYPLDVRDGIEARSGEMDPQGGIGAGSGMHTEVLLGVCDLIEAVSAHWWSFVSSFPSANLPIWFVVLAAGFMTWLADKRPNLHAWIEKNRRSLTLAKWLFIFSVVYAFWAAYDDLNSDSSLWHPLTRVQAARFEAEHHVSNFTFGRISIYYRDGCEDCKDYATSLEELLRANGWNVAATSWQIGEKVKGISIAVGSPVDVTALNVLTESFQHSHILFSISPASADKSSILEIIVNPK